MNNIHWGSEGYIENPRPMSDPGNICAIISIKEGVIFRKILNMTVFLFSSEKTIYVFSFGVKSKTIFKNCCISISGTVLGNRLPGEIIIINRNEE